MKIQVKDKIYEIPPGDEDKLSDLDWCLKFFGDDFSSVAFEPYEKVKNDQRRNTR